MAPRAMRCRVGSSRSGVSWKELCFWLASGSSADIRWLSFIGTRERRLLVEHTTGQTLRSHIAVSTRRPGRRQWESQNVQTLNPIRRDMILLYRSAGSANVRETDGRNALCGKTVCLDRAEPRALRGAQFGGVFADPRFSLLRGRIEALEGQKGHVQRRDRVVTTPAGPKEQQEIGKLERLALG